MKQQEVFKKIGGIINELTDQYKYLENANDVMNDIELEFFVANAAYLAQNAEMLRKLNTQQKQTVNTAASLEKKDEKYFEPLVQHADQVKTTSVALPDADKISSVNISPQPDIDIAPAAPSDSYSFIMPEPEVIRHELEIDESQMDDEEDFPELLNEPVHIDNAPVVIAPPVKVNIPVAEPVTENPQTHQPQSTETLTINQRISAQLAGQNSVGEVQPQITDLKTATSLNDKLLYVKELFNGYNLAYNEAIDILNRFNTFDDADHYLKVNYVAKNDWYSKPDTVAKFYALLRRRYS